MGSKRAAVVLMALVLVATACTQQSGKKVSPAAEDFPRGPQTYTVNLDAPSPEGQNLQLSAFFPGRVIVRPRDTVIFENRSTQAPHTVTFGVKAAFAPEAPFPATKAGLPNPLVFGPCYADTLPPPGSEACPAPGPPAVSPPAYKGAGFWSSGALFPAIAPPEAPRKVTLTVAPETPKGRYTYACLLHKNMTGALEVFERDDVRARPADVAQRAERDSAKVLEDAAKLAEPSFPATDGVTVAAGWGGSVTAVNRFSPIKATVKAGQKVTWKTASPYEPHTVTFASPFKTPEDPGVYTPGGATTGSRYTSGRAHSGLFGPKPFPAETFELIFTKPGRYSYVCVLHPGMGGEVEVTP